MSQVLSATGQAVPPEKVVETIGDIAQALNCPLVVESLETGGWRATMHSALIGRPTGEDIVAAEGLSFDDAVTNLAATISEREIIVQDSENKWVRLTMPVVLPPPHSEEEILAIMKHNEPHPTSLAAKSRLCLIISLKGD